LNGLRGFKDLQSRLGRLLLRGASRAQADHDLDAGISKVVGVREALAAVSDHGNLLRPDPLRFNVLFVEDVHSGAPFHRMVHARPKKSTIQCSSPRTKGGQFSRIVISTLRFLLLPSSVELSPIGEPAPRPRAVIWSARRAPWERRKLAAARARFSESAW